MPTSFNVIQHKPPTLEIYSDASDVGWGALVNGNTAGGLWSLNEMQHHINFEEILAVFFALKCFAINKRNLSVKVHIDNTTVVAILKHMGTSHNHILVGYIKQIWNWYKNGEIWLLPT